MASREDVVTVERDLSGLAEALWRHLEPYHAVVYFSPEHRAACDEVGLRGGWMAYFASRAAPLGAVPAEVVAAVFYNFHPAMVARALPDAWTYATPAAVLEARSRGVGAALDRLLGPASDAPPLGRAAEAALAVADAAEVGGRPMFAANAALPVPDTPALALWHAATMLREHRGDGHVATLVAAGVGPCAAHVLQVAAGVVARGELQPHRGWSDEDWDAAVAELADRGWVHDDGTITAAGRDGRRGIEERTNQLAAAPLARVGRDHVEELLDELRPVLVRLDAAGAVPYPNPMGVPRA